MKSSVRIINNITRSGVLTQCRFKVRGRNHKAMWMYELNGVLLHLTSEFNYKKKSTKRKIQKECDIDFPTKYFIVKVPIQQLEYLTFWLDVATTRKQRHELKFVVIDRTEPSVSVQDNVLLMSSDCIYELRKQ